MRIMMVAGEASGDLHGAGVVRELKKQKPDCEIFGIGGDKMQSEGMRLIYHVRELSVMGFWEVIEHLPLLRSVQKTLQALLKSAHPDVLVLIDYPGFNLRLARFAHGLGIKTLYYISPQVWAWNRGRIRSMKEIVDKMLVVFQFEVDLYRKEGIDVEFVGHPLLEVLTEPAGRKEFCTRYQLDPARPVLGLFPGSRKQELERIFPVMLGAARILYQQAGIQTVVGVSSILEYEFVKSFVRGDFPVVLVQHGTYDVMKNSTVALVTSGTATLETAYYRTPMIIVYKTSVLTYLFARAFIRIRNIGLANIVAGKKIVPEILQHQATPRRLAEEGLKMLQDEGLRKKMSEELAVVRNNLGSPGASERVARRIVACA